MAQQHDFPSDHGLKGNSMTDTPEPTPEAPPIPPARVQKSGDWHLVTHASWEVSVHPDGMLMLPRHLHPHEVDDFVRCIMTAKDIGAGVIKDNREKTPAANPRLNTRQAIVGHGGAPSGTARMQVTSRQHRAASVGRDKRRQGGAR
jgi:hypothetical protein